ncbi:DNA-binding protein [soil metagenome]
MRFQRFESRYQVRLEDGDRIAESLLALLRAERIGYAAIAGLGALRWASISYWNARSGEYEVHEFDEQVELVGLVGNAALRDGEPALHLHATLGRADLSLLGGHFNEAIVHPNTELWISPEPEPVIRVVEPESNMPLMQLPDRVAG